MARLELDNVRVSYNGVSVIPGLSLTVEDGECIALLGPSGCGKTTTLRAVAGFVRPDAGRVRIGGRDMTHCPPHKRNVGLVFQDYALFSHMTVAENVAYGLVRRRVPKADIAAKVSQTLAMVRLAPFGERYPASLSGGQRQRVALARAIAVQPDILLLDEPLGALDRKLRDEMQVELKNLQARLGLTCIIVTHDQEEALSLAARVALMFDGDISEIGAPTTLYHRPGTLRAMDFLGASWFFDARVDETRGGESRYTTADGQTFVGPSSSATVGGAVTLGVRPERIRLSPQRPAGAANALEGKIAQVVFKGPSADVYVAHAGPLLRALVSTESAERGLLPDAPVWASFEPADVLVFASAS
jgi:ABC-type Fe3+/spermidine/putrescine transport system ATPase subunit